MFCKCMKQLLGNERESRKHIWACMLSGRKSKREKYCLPLLFTNRLPVLIAHLKIPVFSQELWFLFYCLIQRVMSCWLYWRFGESVADPCRSYLGVVGYCGALQIINRDDLFWVTYHQKVFFPPAEVGGCCQFSRKRTLYLAVVSLTIPLYVTQPLEHCS